MSNPDFMINLLPPQKLEDIILPPLKYRRSWTYSEILKIFPEPGIHILDLGSGSTPFKPRKQDTLITVDFDPNSTARFTSDVSKTWPFEVEEFDFVYASHVLEHFYPKDRDEIINKIHSSLKEGGLVFIRVPHKSSLQTTGWEHYTFYGLNGVMSLCHGKNPYLPIFRAVSCGVAMTIDFYTHRSIYRSLIEIILNRSIRLTESFLCHLIGGVPEVQFILQKMPTHLEEILKQEHSVSS